MSSRVFNTASKTADERKMVASQTVPFCRTSVVWAPARESIIPPPKAAPRPSCLGRCIRTMRMSRILTITITTIKIPIKIESMGREYASASSHCKVRRQFGGKAGCDALFPCLNPLLTGNMIGLSAS